MDVPDQEGERLSLLDEAEKTCEPDGRGRGESTLRAALSAMIASQGALGIGFALAYSSPVIPDLQNTLLDSEQKVSWFGSVMTVGAAIGCPIAGLCLDRVGRKGTLILTALPFVAGWLLISYAETFALLITGRFTTGVSVGAAATAIPIYIGEISPKSHRGIYGVFVQIFLNGGVFVIYLLGVWLSWNWLAMVPAVCSVLWLGQLLFVPETPRYLMAQGDVTKAMDALTWLRANSSIAEIEFLQIEENVHSNEDKLRLSDILNPRLYRPLIIGIGLMIFQQFSGINAVTFYMKSLFVSANFLADHPNVAPLLAIATQILATLVSMVLLERAGRRMLLILAGVGECVACATLGLYFLLSQRYRVSGIGWMSVLSVCVFLIAFSLGWGPVPGIVMSEILPLRARGLASGLCTVVGWTCAFLVTRGFLPLQQAITPYGVFWAFGGTCFLSVIFVIVFMFETKGKSLEAIEMHFARGARTI